MKHVLLKGLAITLCLVMLFAALTACGRKNAVIDEAVDAAVKAAFETYGAISVVIEADGHQYTIENAEGKTVQQLLDMAGVTLNAGDVLSVSPYQTVAGAITICVQRQITVTISDPEANARYTVVLAGGTIADAFDAAGLNLPLEQLLTFDLEKPLVDGMMITVSGTGIEETVEETQPEETEPDESDSDDSDDSDYSDSDYSDSDYSDSGSNDSGSSDSGSGDSGSSDSGSGDSGSSDSGTTDDRVVVSVEYYDDCDGSGHGVMVITYSDGTQEEVPY